MPDAAPIRFLLTLAMISLLSLHANALEIRVVPAAVNPQGGQWDTGLGRIFKASPDERPDVLICLEASGIGRKCSAVCMDSLECTARFATPSGTTARLLVYDQDNYNASDLIMDTQISAQTPCSPCTDGQGSGMTQYWITGWSIPQRPTRPPRCRPQRPDPGAGVVGQALHLIATQGELSQTALSAFQSRGGAIEICDDEPRPAFYTPETDRIVISSGESQGWSRDLMLRVLFEELAHATTRVPPLLQLPNPTGGVEGVWASAYRDQMMKFEALGWLDASLERESFIRRGIAQPPHGIGQSISVASRADIDAIVAAFRAGLTGRRGALIFLEPIVNRSYVSYPDNNGQIQSISYGDHYGQQGLRIWQCGQRGTAQLSLANGIWICP